MADLVSVSLRKIIGQVFLSVRFQETLVSQFTSNLKLGEVVHIQTFQLCCIIIKLVQELLL